ncbi:MAG: DUF5134 domain-containing protein, partial [Microbacterium sp.]
DPALQWTFTVVFAALAVHSAYRIVVDRTRPAQALGHGLHVLMAADMAAMPWPWWTVIPGSWQIVLFSIATAWFLVLLVLQVRRTIPRRVLGGHGPWHQAGHAVMMLAMVWMVAAMNPVGEAASASGHDPGAAPSAAHTHAAVSGWDAATGIAVTAALLVAGVVLLVEFVDCVRGPARTWRGHTGDVASGAVMSFGMAAMSWLMLAA